MDGVLAQPTLKVTDRGGSNNYIKTVDVHLPWGFGLGLIKSGFAISQPT